LHFLHSLVGVIDPKAQSQKALGQKDGRARDILGEDSEKPIFSEVIQTGGPRSNLNSYQEPEPEGFPSGTGNNVQSSNLSCIFHKI